MLVWTATTGCMGNFTVEEMKGKVQFQPVAKMWANIEEHHFVVKIDYGNLQGNLEHVTLLCQHATELRLKKQENVRRMAIHLVEHCGRVFVRMEKQLQTMDVVFKPNPRQKRQILAGLGIGAALLTSYELSKLGSYANGREELSPDTVTLLQKHEGALTREEDELRHLNNTIRDLALAVVSEQEEFDSMFALEDIRVAVDAEERYVERVCGALESLTQSRLTTRLLPAETTRTVLRRLQAQLKEKGRQLAFKKLRTFYQQLVTFDVIGPRKVMATVTLPTTKIGTPMDVYKLLTAVVQVNGSEHDWVVDESELLGVNEDQSFFQILSPRSMNNCPVMEGITICQRNNIVWKDFSSHCLSSLYHQLEGSEKLCSTYVLPLRTWVEQIHKNEFLIYHPEQTSTLFKCGSRQEMQRLRGMFRVRLNDCSASTSHYSIEGMAMLADTEATTNVSADWNIEKILEFQGSLTTEDLTRNMKINDPTPVKDIRPLLGARGVTITHSIITYGLICLLSAIIVVIVVVLWRARNRGREAREASRYEEIHLNVNTGQNEAEDN